jgi:hypothetical protein
MYVSPKTYKWSGTFIIKDGRYTFTFIFLRRFPVTRPWQIGCLIYGTCGSFSGRDSSIKAVRCKLSDPGLFPYRGKEFLRCSYTYYENCVCNLTECRVGRRYSDTAAAWATNRHCSLFYRVFRRNSGRNVGAECPNDVLLAYECVWFGRWLQSFRKWSFVFIFRMILEEFTFQLRALWRSVSTTSVLKWKWPPQDKQNSTSGKGETSIHCKEGSMDANPLSRLWRRNTSN